MSFSTDPHNSMHPYYQDYPTYPQHLTLQLPSFKDLLQQTEAQEKMNVKEGTQTDAQLQSAHQEIERLLKLLQNVQGTRQLEQQQFAQLKLNYDGLMSYSTQLASKIEQLEKKLGTDQESTKKIQLALGEKERIVNRQKQELYQKQQELLKANQVLEELKKSMHSSESEFKDNLQKYTSLQEFCGQLELHIQKLENQLVESRQTNQALIASINTTYQEQLMLKLTLEQNNQRLAKADKTVYHHQRTIEQQQVTILNLQKENQVLRSKLENVGKITSTVDGLLGKIKETK